MPTTEEHFCPDCGQAVKPDWGLCPNCGQANPATPGRIRCRVCGRPAKGALHVCPHCGADLEAKPLPFLQMGLGVVALVGLIFGLFQAWPALSNQSQRLVVLVNPPTATPTATATTTPTATLSPTSTPTPLPPTDTPTATASPSPTSTATPTATPTETAVGAPTATSTPTVTPTPTPRYGKPVLLGPEENKIYGRDEELVLRWRDMGPLAPNEWYAVRMTWLQDGQVTYGGTNVKDNFWVVPPDMFWGLADQFTGRQYEWVVYVEEITTDENGKKMGRPVSEVSDPSTFMWQ